MGMLKRPVLLAVIYCCAIVSAAEAPSTSLDLRKLGYRLTGDTNVFVDYSDLTFLSDSLLVIAINQRSFGSVELTFADRPESTIVIFDVKRAIVIATGKMAVEKMSGSIQAISGERFAVLNEKGLQFCTRDLRCVLAAPQVTGPMIVSPQGRRLAVCVNKHNDQRIIDTETMKVAPVEKSPIMWKAVVAIPGDGATLVDQQWQIAVQRSGREEVPLSVVPQGTYPECRFLNAGLLVCLAHDASEARVFGTDGREVRRYKVEEAWRTGFLPVTSGTRFGIYEHGYTSLNSILNFFDIDDGRPQNFQRVRIIDLASGKEVSRLEWDPRPHLIKPAISPDGHVIARVREGMLEVLRVN